jgi:hypothetical protein
MQSSHAAYQGDQAICLRVDVVKVKSGGVGRVYGPFCCHGSLNVFGRLEQSKLGLCTQALGINQLELGATVAFWNHQ